ncbi:MAG: hypothetical protein K2G22_08740 [Eubacterium sp.]|nr:hypothetical protein [Eubacterium sp.]
MTNKIFSKVLIAAFSSALITFLLISAVFLWVYKTDFQSVLSLIARYSYVIVIIIIAITAISLIAANAVTKRIVKPIEKMGSDLKNISENCPYEELKPFTEKIKAQIDEKDRLEHLTKQFTANLSHELKTPLTAISGYGELLENTTVSAEDVARFGTIIYKESQRLINLTHDIIQLSQLEEYDFKPIIDSVDLTAVAKSCADALSVEAQKRNITLTVDGESEYVRGTKALLEDLIYNLVENAIRYNVENGSVFISIKKETGGTALVVKDTGIGIPEKYLSRIFERFFRVDKSRSKETGGTGLGLAIVKHTAEYLGGTVKMESKENEGTTVTVYLPKK